MNIEQAFPSNYIKAADLQGKTVNVTIARVLMEEIGQAKDRKPVIYFDGKEKGLVLNRTNSNTIAQVYGQETDDWIGGELTLFTVMTDMQGRSVEAVRVRIPPRRPSQQQGGVGFAPNARDRARQEPPPATADSYGASRDADDQEIPF